MTKEQIQDRIKELETNRETLKANFIAIEGAIQDCNYWLEQGDKPAEATKVDQKMKTKKD